MRQRHHGKFTLGTPINGTANIDSKQINDHWDVCRPVSLMPTANPLSGLLDITDHKGKPETARYYMQRIESE